MSTLKKVFLSTVATGLCGSLLAAVTPVAAGDIGFSVGGSTGVDTQNGVTAEAGGSADGEFYQEDLKPGITFSKIDSGPSKLSEAAKNRQSISISANPEEDASKAKSHAPKQQVYRVKEGDTLWEICESNFGDAYVWPRIWSYNPGITNPNWIYPGDMLLLSPPVARTAVSPKAADKPAAVAVAAMQRSDARLIRNRGFVDKNGLEQAGIVRGAQKEIMMLSQLDEAYVEFKKNKDIQVGDEFAAFRILKEVDSVEDPGTEMGKLVEILGAVRVTSFDKKNKIARVVIDESMRPIERGTLIGPIHKRFNLVPSATNEVELKGHVIAHLDPTIVFTQEQIVFVDKGHKDGVKEGNRFFAMRKRDEYRASMNQKDDNEHYPFEVLAEMRVIEVRPETSTCLITASTRILKDGAPVEMVKGY
jgi:hypothetical protein